MICIQPMDHFVYCFLQRLNEARRMMDKLRACIVANYFASAGMTKATEVNPDRTWTATLLFKHLSWSEATTVIPSVSQHLFKSDPAVLNHPTIRRFLESPSRSSSPLNQGSETPSLVHSDFESLSQQGDAAERDGEGVWRDDGGRPECRPARNTGKVSSCQEGNDSVFIGFSKKKKSKVKHSTICHRIHLVCHRLLELSRG